MDKISDVTVGPYSKSQYAKPVRMQYTQNGVKKDWDFLVSGRSVSIVIFNTTRKVLVVVRQFRPAVYYSAIPDVDKKDIIDVEKYPGKLGITLELCAGSVDKDKTTIEIAQDEVLEECGYQVPLSNIEEVITYTPVSSRAGSRQTLFYAEVTDDMKVSAGGGLQSEGEFIEVMEMTIYEAELYLQKREVLSSGNNLFGLLWFLHNKKPLCPATEVSHKLSVLVPPKEKTMPDHVKPCPYVATYNNVIDGVKKNWDLVKVHQSVSIIIFNVSRKVFVFVRQFRPPVYYSAIPETERKDNLDVKKYPAKLGITLELCAGVVDKSKTLKEIAQDEVLEECGYHVPLENLHEVITYKSGVGIAGDRQTLFYAEVADDMKVSAGGGLASEGELIDVVEMTIEDAQKYLKQDEVPSPGGLLFALLWFMHNKLPHYQNK